MWEATECRPYKLGHYPMHKCRQRRIISVIRVSALLPVTAFLLLIRYCPQEGIAFSRQTAYFHRLKNRTVLPQPQDFDPRANLSSFLQTGDDRTRWSTSRAGRL